MSEHTAEIDELVQEALRVWQVPGVSLAVVQGDAVVYLFDILRSSRNPDPARLFPSHQPLDFGGADLQFGDAGVAFRGGECLEEQLAKVRNCVGAIERGQIGSADGQDLGLEGAEQPLPHRGTG